MDRRVGGGGRRAVERPAGPAGGGRAGESIAPARRAAYRVLLEVGAGRGHSDELLYATGPAGALSGLNEADTRLATALVLGVLRWQIALDARLRRMFSRPEAEVAPELMVALRMGAFQLLHMDRIPAHAALSESVALARAAGQEHATGMVNAVLRKVAAGPKIEAVRVFERPAVFAERLGHPAWMVQRWAVRYGRELAMGICEADQREPEREGGGLFAEDGGSPLMDAGSRLVAELTAAVAPAVGDGALRVWDCCAAPGGKTAVLAERLRGHGPIEVLAADVSAKRLRAMEVRMGALAASAGEGGPVRCLVADARSLPAEEGQFDLVLCDVPCSGTGTLGRNPEIRLRLAEAELERQAERQREILRAAMGRTAAGGRVVYSTCSMEPEECEAVVDAVLREIGKGWKRVAVGAVLDAMKSRGVLQAEAATAAMVEQGALRTVPGRDGMDGFFAVVLERAALTAGLVQASGRG